MATQFYPRTVQSTVNELMANSSLSDITKHVETDPKHPFSVGSGAAGDVYRAIYNVVNPDTDKPYKLNVVVKILKGSADQKESIRKRVDREIACWCGLRHANVAELLGIAYLLPGQVAPGLVSKWVVRHNFLQYIGNHPDLKRSKAKEVASGLKYLHEQNVVHGDLKVDNVIISNQLEAQIIDFGIAQMLDLKGFTTMADRNVRYAAPELIPVHPPAGDDSEVNMPPVRPTPQSDIYSLGILLLQLFHGPDENKQRERPYNHIAYNPNYDIGLVRRIHAGERPIKNNYNHIEDQHWQLICRCWAHRPEERPNSAEVQAAL